VPATAAAACQSSSRSAGGVVPNPYLSPAIRPGRPVPYPRMPPKLYNTLIKKQVRRRGRWHRPWELQRTINNIKVGPPVKVREQHNFATSMFQVAWLMEQAENLLAEFIFSTLDPSDFADSNWITVLDALLAQLD